ncbi:MAG TPA: hypothetical protein VM940_00300 [Chthoniobacterales bacterium]|jgi:hypothetical protein|nr:hypothetical protein [Chthoniobacterales bacterium]
MTQHEKVRDFADKVHAHLLRKGINVGPEYAIEVGISSKREKKHRFDFGSPLVLVECKHYDWTESGGNPAAKIATINEALLYFLAAPQCKKMLFVPKTGLQGIRRQETLIARYLRLHGHLIPDDVEIWEFDKISLTAERIV